MSWKTPPRNCFSFLIFVFVLICMAMASPVVPAQGDDITLTPAMPPATATVITASPTPVRRENASSLRAKMMRAYEKIQTYRATIELTRSEHKGRWKLVEQLEVAYDRTSHSLRFDRPDMLLINADGYLRYRSDMIQGRYLQVRIAKPLDYRELIRRAPFLTRQQMPDLKLLLGGDPIDTLDKVRALPADDRGCPGLQWSSPRGQMTLRLDPNTYLIRRAILQRQAKMQRANMVGPVTFNYKITVRKYNQEFEQEWFVFDTSNAQQVNSWEDLLDANDVDAVSLEGASAPPLVLQNITHDQYRLEEDKADVVVLFFWASWGGPPVYRALPVLQRLADWAREEKKSVSIRAVNVRDSAEDILQVWEIKRMGIKVLMDSDARAAHAYRVGALPQTVVIADGQIVHVHVGVPHEFETVLRAQVSALLEETTITQK